MKQSEYIQSSNIYSFRKALEANYFLTPEQQEQTMLFCYFHQNDFPVSMHSHEFYEINIITEGRGTHYIEDNGFSIKSGDFFIIPPNIRHGYDETENLKIFHIILADSFFTRYRDVLRSIHGYSLLFNIEPQLRAKSKLKMFPSISAGDFRFFLNEINKLLRLNKSAEHMYEAEKCVKTLNLICEFAAIVTSDEYKSSAQSSIDIRQITKVLSYIDTNYGADISLASLCKLCNMSRSTLLHQFKVLCNCSPTDYIRQVRIENARKLLAETDLSVATVAQECGFYDSSHFTKTFLQNLGILPKDYRRNSKE